MKRKWLLFGSTLLLFLFLLTAINNGITGEKSSGKKGYLGVSIEDLDRRAKKEFGAEFGVLVSRVEIDSPADEYGLMEDDVIQTVNGVKIRQPHTLTRVIRKIKPGDKAKIVVVRDGAKKTLSIVIGKVKSDVLYSYSTGDADKKLISFFGGDRAYLGVQLHNLNKDLASYFGVKMDEGALVLNVNEDSPAKKSGFKSGDIITKIDGEKISGSDDVVEIISDYEDDDEVEISIIRQKKKQNIKVTLSEQKHHGNIFFGPDKNLKHLQFKSDFDNKVIKLKEGNVFIDSPKSQYKVKKNKTVKKIINGAI